jgi:hypothetical protein
MYGRTLFGLNFPVMRSMKYMLTALPANILDSFLGLVSLGLALLQKFQQRFQRLIGRIAIAYNHIPQVVIGKRQ